MNLWFVYPVVDNNFNKHIWTLILISAVHALVFLRFHWNLTTFRNVKWLEFFKMFMDSASNISSNSGQTWGIIQSLLKFDAHTKYNFS